MAAVQWSISPPHEAEVARLALIFSMERREIADEINITTDWSYGLVSAIYKKLGAEEILSGEVKPEEYLGDHPLILKYFQQIISQVGTSHKHRDMKTLAFHILTVPEVQDIS
jgi:hypothetical protein